MALNSEIFHKVVDHFIDTKELGSWDAERNIVCLYDIENKPEVIKRIKNDISKITTKFNLVVLDKKDQFTNINVLDIDI